MSKYDKELQTGTDEYEKAIKPLDKAEERDAAGTEREKERKREEEQAER
jgi:hypothetical protein